MRAIRKIIFHLVWVLIITQLMLTTASAITEFYLTTNSSDQRIHCDFLEIKTSEVVCTDNKLLLTYKHDIVKNIEVIYKGQSYTVRSFDQETVRKINAINSSKLTGGSTEERHDINQADNTSSKLASMQHSLTDFVKDVKRRYKQNKNTKILSLGLAAVGFVVFLVGGFWFLIATFRVGILWGLSCLLLPFMPLIFLFVHWKSASRPFIIQLLGIALIFSGTMLMDKNGQTRSITRSPAATSQPKKQQNAKYTCDGKVYCSEMTSCAEAKFYLRNCPGTKMDGNGDGVPCEKQWCR